MKGLILISVSFLLYLMFSEKTFLLGQMPDNEIRTAIERMEKGQSEEVKKELPALAAKYQNNPGILYLQGRLTSDGIEAVKYYQGVVDNFPGSEWADDALYRIYQYYYSLGLYRSADLKLGQLKKDYPASPYVTGKTETKTENMDEEKVKLPEKEIIPADTLETLQAPLQKTPKPYTIQVGAFSTSANAEKQKMFFETLGYTVEITNKIRSGKNLFLVWVGSFQNIEEARSAAAEITAKHKIESMIVER